jgi:hypothetical protein
MAKGVWSNPVESLLIATVFGEQEIKLDAFAELTVTIAACFGIFKTFGDCCYFHNVYVE